MQQIYDWITNHQSTIFGIILIILAAWILSRFGKRIIEKSVQRSIRPKAFASPEEERKRENTISAIIINVFYILLWPIVVIIILGQLGVEIGPLIAGAGIVGVALGFGAQSLVKDVISGLFIIMENQYDVGDVVSLDGTSGMVENITLRKTVLRDLDGIAHHVPNGSITTAANYSSEFSGINLDIRISYDSDLEKVIKVVNEVGSDLADDETWKVDIIEPPQFLRVDNFGESSIDIKITGKVRPLRQWDVTGELRKRLKIAFDKADIEMPYPQRVIHEAKKK